jgi:hypothetical protein
VEGWGYVPDNHVSDNYGQNEHQEVDEEGLFGLISYKKEQKEHCDQLENPTEPLGERRAGFAEVRSAWDERAPGVVLFLLGLRLWWRCLCALRGRPLIEWDPGDYSFMGKFA